MIKKVCDIYQFGESYIFHPKNNSSLENLCLVPCENHIGSNFESSNIFDFRTEILNKCINKACISSTKLFCFMLLLITSVIILLIVKR